MRFLEWDGFWRGFGKGKVKGGEDVMLYDNAPGGFLDTWRILGLMLYL